MTREPAVLAAAVAAIISAAVLLITGTELGEEAQAAIVTVITLIAGAVIRSRVTPAGPVPYQETDDQFQA